MNPEVENVSVDLSAERMMKIRNLGLMPQCVIQSAFNTLVDSMLEDEEVLIGVVKESAEWRERQPALVA